MSLRFKGDPVAKKKKKKKRARSDSDDDDEDAGALLGGGAPGTGSSAAAGPSSKKSKKERKREIESEVAETVVGTGRIVATNDTINGFNSLFQTEIEPGDEIVVSHPGSLQTEKRAVTKVLGNRSLLIVSPFSANFSSTCEFKVEKRGRILRAKLAAELEDEDDGAEGDAAIDKAMAEKVEKALKKQKKTIQVREKVYGTAGVSYRTVRKEMDRDMTAEDALNERVKLGRDKFCW